MTVQDVRRFIGYLGSDRVSKTPNLGPIRITPSGREKETARTVEGIALTALKNTGGGLDVGTRKALETARSLAAAFAKGDVVIYDAKENFIRDIWFRFLNIFRREPFYISKQSIGLGTTATGHLERAAVPSPQALLEEHFLLDPFFHSDGFLFFAELTVIIHQFIGYGHRARGILAYRLVADP